MLYERFGSIEFFAIVTTIALFVGRWLKELFPSMPDRALPWIVSALAIAAVFADALTGGVAPLDAALRALGGLVSGAIATGVHEHLKAPLALLPKALREALLGKLGGGDA